VSLKVQVEISPNIHAIAEEEYMQEKVTVHCIIFPLVGHNAAQKVLTLARDQNYKANQCASHVTIITCINPTGATTPLSSRHAHRPNQTIGSGSCTIISH